MPVEVEKSAMASPALLHFLQSRLVLGVQRDHRLMGAAMSAAHLLGVHLDMMSKQLSGAKLVHWARARMVCKLYVHLAGIFPLF